mmetsp:Transcript_15667/g.33488  ORF Transcript_15667/g.33488 Transcript_15667/m.33488 type:complete len:220 (+) Transcript_15667:711-1370(+)
MKEDRHQGSSSHSAASGLRQRKHPRKRAREVTYCDMISSALQQLPSQQGTLDEIYAVIEEQHGKTLNFENESGPRQIPVWKASVRKIINLNGSRFHRLPSERAGQAVFTLATGARAAARAEATREATREAIREAARSEARNSARADSRADSRANDSRANPQRPKSSSEQSPLRSVQKSYGGASALPLQATSTSQWATPLHHQQRPLSFRPACRLSATAT